jgi:hypothetical protein
MWNDADALLRMWQIMHLTVGQPILAGVPSGDGFQPAHAGLKSRGPRQRRLKGGRRQNCLPHKTGTLR